MPACWSRALASPLWLLLHVRVAMAHVRSGAQFSLSGIGSSHRTAMLIGVDARSERLGRAHQYEQARQALQLRMQAKGKGAVMLRGQIRKLWQHPPGWFGSFDEGESTFDQDFVSESTDNPERDVLQGWAPSESDDLGRPGANVGLFPQWFQESESGGPKAAWQTEYPALADSAGGREAPLASFSPTATGRYRQDLMSSSTNSFQQQVKPASWFDSGVELRDAFGRLTAPDKDGGRAYVEWEERTRSANLTCANPGCVANKTLQLFDAGTERAKLCRLTFRVHPTDFDDDFSAETVEWFMANGNLLNSKCNPKASGCNASTQQPLYPCLSNYDIDGIINKTTGKLKLAGKITRMVDECPMDGFLLNGHVAVTCFVAPKAVVATTVTTTTTTMLNGTCALQCATPNCTATCKVRLDQALVANSTCKLNVQLQQTDFDGDLGELEEVSWLEVDGKSIAAHLKPGKNPCKSTVKGGAHELMHPANRTFDAVTDHDVTADAGDGEILISGKISAQVDECASNGFLLDAIANVTCTANQTVANAP